MRIKIIFLTLLFLASTLFSQTMNWQNPLPGGNDINDVQFVNASTGFAVCSGGLIMKTTDAGLTWKMKDVSTAQACTLKKVFFVDNVYGWSCGVVGTAPFFVKTTDGGSSWSTITVSTLTSVQAMYFRNKTLGWVTSADGKIAKTTDGGTTWVLKTSGITSSIYGIYFSSDLAGITFSTGGVVRKTTDGGETWVAGTTLTYDISCYHFVTPTLGYSAGASANLYKTTDAGSSWTTMTSPSTTSNYVDICFVNENLGYVLRDAATSSASVYKTVDGGTTWTKPYYTSPMIGALCMSYLNDTTGYVFGRKGGICKSTDGDIYWNTVSIGTTTPIKDVFFSPGNEKLGWAVGFDNGGNVYGKTTDAGRTWTFPTTSLFKPYNIYFVNDNYGWVSGDAGSISKTTDGGTTWTSLNANAAGDHMYDIFFIDTLTGWSVGSNRTLKTTDGGTTWTTLLYGVMDAGGNSIYFLDANTGFKGSSTNNYTTDGGTTWSAKSTLNNYPSTITFANNKVGFAVGSSKVIKTTDGGLTWTPVFLAPSSIYGVACQDTSNIWVAGSSGGLFRSTDGGANWTRVPGLLSGDFNSVAIRKGNVWAGGVNGAIVSTIDMFTAVDEETRQYAKVKSFELNQNYPNPFNPATTISFVLSQANHVTLDIYNQLGQLVESLVNKDLKQGEHKIAWSPKNLTSGIYFYRLNYAGSSITKKLIYLK